jgi:hypothetical protein
MHQGFGGLHAQMFGRLHLNEVAGMVLLDSSSMEAPAALKTRARLVPGSVARRISVGSAEAAACSAFWRRPILTRP